MVNTNALFQLIRLLVTLNLLYVVYLLVVGWQDVWFYRAQIPFLYIISPDFYSWKLYSAIILPALVTFACWKPKPIGLTFLYSALILESLKHVYLISRVLLLSLLQPSSSKSLLMNFSLELFLLSAMVVIVFYLKKHRDIFLGEEKRPRPSWITVTCLVAIIAVGAIYLPRVEYATRLGIMKTGANNQKIVISQSQWVSDVAFSPDGRYVAPVLLLSQDPKEINIWEVSARQIPISFKASYTIQAATFSPDGQYLVIGRGAGADEIGIEVWEIATGQKIERLKRSAPSGRKLNTVSKISFSPSGAYVAAPTGFEKDFGLEIWDFRTGGLVTTLKGSRFNWLSDNRYAAGDLRKISIIDFTSGNILRTLDFSNQDKGLMVGSGGSPDGRYLALHFSKLVRGSGKAHNEDMVEIYSVETGQMMSQLSLKQNGKIRSMAFSSDSRFFVIGGEESNEIKLWDMETGQLIRELQHLAPKVTVLAFSQDGKRLMSGGEKMIVVWSLE